VSRVTAEVAAFELDRKLRSKSWYISVGVGQTERGADAIFLYVKNSHHRELVDMDKVWMGYQLVIESIGSIKPATLKSQMGYC
jgi:hypothetical protein